MKNAVHPLLSLFKNNVVSQLTFIKCSFSSSFFIRRHYTLANAHLVPLVFIPLLLRVRHPVPLHATRNAVQEDIQKKLVLHQTVSVQVVYLASSRRKQQLPLATLALSIIILPSQPALAATNVLRVLIRKRVLPLPTTAVLRQVQCSKVKQARS